MKRDWKKLCILAGIGALLWMCCAIDVRGQTVVSTNTAEVVAAGKTNAPSATIARPEAVWLSFGLNRVELLQSKPFADVPLWQFIASIVYVFLAFYISKLLDFVIRERLQKWAAKTKTRLDDIILDLLRGPVKIVSFVILLHIGMEVYSWPEWLSKFLSAGLKIVVALSITYVLLKSVDAVIGVWRERTTNKENEQFSKQLLPLIGKTLKVFVMIVVLLVTSQNLGLNVTGLIASLSIGGLAIGLAAQDTLANLFGAVAILVDKPFNVGDRVQLETVDGTVESIGFRSTRIRNLDGFMVTVPNKTMGNATITNVSLRPNIKSVMNFGVTYDTPPEKVERAIQIIQEVFLAEPFTHDLLVTFDKFTDFTLNIQVIYWWKGAVYKDFLAALNRANLTIMTKFGQEGIEFAFPTRTVYIKQQAPLEIRAEEAPILDRPHIKQPPEG